MLGILQQTDLILGPLLTTFLIGFTTIVLILWYSIRKQSYWKKIGIPYVKPTPILGSVIENLSKPLHDLEMERYNKYGRIYGHYEGNIAVLTLAKPEIIRNILVKDFPSFTGRRRMETGNKVMDITLTNVNGEDWKRIRTIVSPTFSTGKIKRMMSIFKNCSETLAKNFKKAAEKGEAVDVKRLYSAFTMDVIASAAFSTKIDSHNDPNNLFVKSARSVFDVSLNWRFVVLILFPSLVKHLKLKVFPGEGISFFTNVTLQIIEERKKTGQTRNDFLQLLLDTGKELAQEGKLDLNEKDDIAENYGKEERDQAFKQTFFTKKSLSLEEVVAQALVFFLAGFETTASTLSFASCCLALNPDVQEKLIEELDGALRENNGELTYEAVQSVKCLDNVISETLRLYPPAVRLERIADEDYKLGDTGLTVPKGMIVGIPIYAMHRDPKFFPDPERFDPDRFTAEERAKRELFTYMPFGAGPRNCVAMRFALMEIKVCLAHVLSNFRIKKSPQTKVPLEFHSGRGLLQPKDITLLLEVRKDTVKAMQNWTE